MAGVAVNMEKQPKAHAAYNVYLVSSYYITYLSVFMDYVRIRNDFEESMKNVRMLFGMGLIMWMHLCLRYFRLHFLATQAQTVAVMCVKKGLISSEDYCSKNFFGRVNLHFLHRIKGSVQVRGLIKSRRMRWKGHLARKGDTRGSYRVLVGRPEGKKPLRRPRRRWENNIETDVQEVRWGGMNWFTWLRLGIGGGHLGMR
jgi:hypothetical protein